MTTLDFAVLAAYFVLIFGIGFSFTRRGRSSTEYFLADRNVLTDQLGRLNERRNPLVAAAVHPGEIISSAGLPTDPSSPKPALYLGSGLAAGLLAGLVGALVADRLNRRVHRRRDLADQIRAPVLMETPGKVSALGVAPPNDPLAHEIGRLRNVLSTGVDRADGGERAAIDYLEIERASG